MKYDDRVSEVIKLLIECYKVTEIKQTILPLSIILISALLEEAQFFLNVEFLRQKVRE